MSEMKHHDLVWLPAPFPAQGRLPAKSYLLVENCQQQDSQEKAYYQELCLAANRRVIRPCCNTLHVSLFFDGTGNNLYNDLYQAVPNHPTNVVRLFQATIGAGYAGGASGKPLLDDVESTGGKYFKYYIPGVGTPFPEIDDLDYTTWEVTARYLTSGELITLLKGPEYRKAFTHNVGEVTRQQREFLKERRLQMTKDDLKARWAGKTLEPTPFKEPEK